MTKLICTLIGMAGLILTPRSAVADNADTLLKDEMQKHQIAGLALMVIKDGLPIKTTGYGVANLELNVPVTQDTVFEIGSVTKQFTAACIMLLVQDGKLSLDDRICDHLKNAPAIWTNITVRHLLTHTSGVTNYTALDGFELRQHLTQEQFIQKLGAYPLSFQPGEKWAYSNSGYSLLGYIIENVSGEGYWIFLRERILQPLGMNATTDRNPRFVVPNRASGYELTNHVSINRDYDLTDLFSAGAIVSTVLDMAKWNAALDGEKLLTKASKEQMWTPTRLGSGKVQDYGFGWFLDPYHGHENIGHNGQTSGFSAAIQRFPDDHLSVIALCNADEMSIATTLARKVADFYFSEPPAKH